MGEYIIKELKRRYEIDKESLAADQLRVLLDYEVARNEIGFSQGLYEGNEDLKEKIKETINNLEEVLAFAKTGQDERSKIQCEILENIINKLRKELLES